MEIQECTTIDLATLDIEVTEENKSIDTLNREIEKVIKAVILLGPYPSVHREAIKNKTRRQAVLETRQIAMYFVNKKFPALGSKKIGTYFGKYDHSTVLNAFGRVNDLIDSDPRIRESVNNIKRYLNL